MTPNRGNGSFIVLLTPPLPNPSATVLGSLGQAWRRAAQPLPWQRRDAMAETLFLKVERVRRLHNARLTEVDVQRGEDGSFGIGLSDENEITNFHHETNAQLLQVGNRR